MIVLTECYWLEPPGPREPGTTVHKRHFHESEYLLMLAENGAFVHIRKKDVHGNSSGPVRTVSTAGMECIYKGIPSEVEKASRPEVPVTNQSVRR